jgi:hypothetical protein
MSKANIIIDGAGTTATFNSSPISDIVKVSFCSLGAREEINLTTIDAAAYHVGLLGDLVEVPNVVITKKAAPAVDIAMSLDNKTLVVGFKVGKATAKTYTAWAQLIGISKSQISREPGDGINVDLTFGITNLNASLVETGPVIA